MKKNKVGLIGAGLMGQPMGFNWLKNGFELTCLPHKNKNRVEELVARGARAVSSYSEFAEHSDFIVIMVPTSRQVEAVVTDLLPHLKPQHIVIDMSTSEPASTREIFKKFKSKGLRFFDSPVTGGVKGAVEGTLTLFVGGPAEYFQEAQPMLKAVSRLQTHFGDIGQGHVAKIINNFVCIGNLAVFSEALPLAIKAGLEPRAIFQTLCTGTGQSKMLDLYGEQILGGDFAPRFKLAHAFKDLGLALDLTQESNGSLPVLQATFDDFKKAMDTGLGEQNVSSLIQVFENQLGAKFRS